MFSKLNAGGNTVSYFHECCFSAIVTFAHKTLRHGSRSNPPPWGVTPPFVNRLWRCPLDFAKSRPTGGPVLFANPTICNTFVWHYEQIALWLFGWHFFPNSKLNKLYFLILSWIFSDFIQCNGFWYLCTVHITRSVIIRHTGRRNRTAWRPARDCRPSHMLRPTATGSCHSSSKFEIPGYWPIQLKQLIKKEISVLLIVHWSICFHIRSLNIAGVLISKRRDVWKGQQMKSIIYQILMESIWSKTYYKLIGISVEISEGLRNGERSHLFGSVIRNLMERWKLHLPASLWEFR